MALKFKETNWDFYEGNQPFLQYVVFEEKGKTFKWYPKWSDLGNIFETAYSTEAGNKGKLAPYFGIVAIGILIEMVFQNKGFEHNDSMYKALYQVKEAMLRTHTKKVTRIL